MLLALALGAALAGAGQDSVVVRAMLSSERIPTGTSTVLVISVETSGPMPSEIPVPVLPAGLELGPVSDFSQLQVAFPGGRRRTTRREIVVLARAPGRYRIPAVEIDVAGRRHATRTLDLTVVGVGAATAPGPGERTVELRAWIVPDTVYAGQQILFRAEAAFPESLRLRQTRAPVFDPPATTGFWVYDVPDPVTVGLRVVGNETFEVQSFRQVLFPLHPGDHQIPPAGMRYEFRAGSIFSPETRQLSARPIAVHVRPLPPGRPAAFQGAVGEYTLQVSLAADRARVGDAVTLRATLEGAGNIKALPRPELPPLAGVDVQTGPEQVEVGFSDDRVTGRKTFEWLLVARAPGRLEVPGIRYAWFDPTLERFHQVGTAPLALTIEPAFTGDRAGEALAPLRSGDRGAPLAFVHEPWFLALQALPLLLLLLFALRRGRGARPAAAGATRIITEEELRALSRVGDARLCLERLGTLLQRAIGGASGEEQRSLRALHERVRQARYAPEPPDAQTCARLLSEARMLLARRPGRATPRLVILWLLLFPGPLHAQQHEPGLRAFSPAEADRAVLVFTSAVRARPDHATAWYHLGHAFAAREQRGRAAWAWLRALELEPRAADTRQNLYAVGARPALDALGPRVPLSTDELALLAALAWWAAALVLLPGLRGRRRALQLAGATLALIALLCLALVAARRRPATRAITLERIVLRAAPALRADSVASLAPATPLRLRDLRGDWARVVDPEQREGWLEHALIGRL